MLKSLTVAAAIALSAFTASSDKASAQFNAEWCTQGWMTDCAYYTLAQCRAAASGNGWSCVRNQNYQRKERQRR